MHTATLVGPPTATSTVTPSLSRSPLDDRIFVHQAGRMVRILLRDVCYIEAQRAYCRIVTASKDYTLSISLGSLEQQLPPQRLVRIHRSYLVNPLAIREIGESNVVIGERCLPVGKTYRRALRDRIRLIS